MSLFTVDSDVLNKVYLTDFFKEDIKERADLQRVLRDHPDAIEPGLFVVSEEYGEFEESKRRIDLLALDSRGNIVVVELKRTQDDVFMDLQAIRYAALVSSMTFEDLLRAHEQYLAKREIAESGRDRLLGFLGIDVESGMEIGSNPRIILVSPSFSKELTTSVLWLHDQKIDIQCVQMTLYKLGTQVLMDFTQIIPLPQVSDYQVRIRQKAEAARAALQKVRRERTIQTLAREGKVSPGDMITVLPSAVRRDSLENSDPMYRAQFAPELLRQQNVIWEKDGNLYSLSNLCEHMRDNFNVDFSKGGINGYACWSLEGSLESLWDLAEKLRPGLADE